MSLQLLRRSRASGNLNGTVVTKSYANPFIHSSFTLYFTRLGTYTSCESCISSAGEIFRLCEFIQNIRFHRDACELSFSHDGAHVSFITYIDQVQYQTLLRKVNVARTSSYPSISLKKVDILDVIYFLYLS